MVLNNHYWYFKSALPVKLCEDIIKHGINQKEQIAKTGGYHDDELNEEQIKDLKKKRNSNIVWMDDLWIYRAIHPYIHQANKNAGWNFEWSRSESCQFTKYKLNQFYDWHCDTWDKPYDQPGHPDNGKIRKLSLTCQLTDGSEYEGGELEFDFRNYDPNKRVESDHQIQCKEILPIGSIVVFPSFVWHRVKPVTSGVRYSLVMWNVGYPYK